MVLCAYNSLIPQIGICKVKINDKGIKHQCSIFVVAKNRPALLKCQIVKNYNC